MGNPNAIEFMKSRHVRLPALLLSGLLQLAPLLRVAATETAAVASPLVAMLRWLAGASAVAGSFHAVSAGTGLTVTGKTTGTNGLTFGGARVSISSFDFGTAKSYSAVGLPPGINLSRLGVFSGRPTAAGIFNADVTGWQKDDLSGFNFANTVQFTIVNQAPVTPVITQPPTPLTVTEGQPASFSAMATGTPAPTFQWLYQNAPITSAISPQFQITKTTLTDAGGYAVIALNSAGSVTSAPVTLTVIPLPKPPVITNQPVSLTVKEGEAATFSVGATGTAPLAYQWTYQSGPIPAATNATLTLANVLAAQSGTYQVKVSNTVTNVLSQVVNLSVTPKVVVGPFNLGPPLVVGGGVSFNLPVVASAAYVVEFRDGLGAANWTLLTNVAPPTANGSAKIIDQVRPGARFYRARSSP